MLFAARNNNDNSNDNTIITGTGRPSLLAGLQLPPSLSSPPGGRGDDDDFLWDNNNNNNNNTLSESSLAGIPPRPRRLWKVNDNALKAVPYFFPPLDPRCTVFVSDAPPSVVAVRIAECLRKRSISVEYDEEAVSLF